MNRVLIVGGGSAGWMTASYLNGALNDQGRKRNVEITLIESPDIPPISVGEATIPSIRHVLTVIGLDEIEFMKATDATFKQSIKYVNWMRKDGSHYHHPFSRYRVAPVDRSGRSWLESDRSIPFMETVSAQPLVCEMGLAPQMLGKWTLGAPLSYAFHMNAQKFADYLRDFSTARGVNHVLANVTDVNVGPTGLIESVATDRTDELEAELFIDCTGFRAALIGKALDVPYDDCSQWLLCDHAVAAHIPYDDFFPGMVRPYTTATALSAGWVWDIPMQTQRSIGYVHSSQFINEDDAEAELRAYEGTHGADLDTRRIRFQVGRRRKAWEGNCIAVGLSGGFIEPLESTGLYLCDLAAVMLAEHFPYKPDHYEKMAFRFNRILSNRFYEILDFINMHYCLSRRSDTAFWREVQKPERITDRLKAKFDYWKIKPPSASDFDDQFFPGAPLEAPTRMKGLGDPRAPIDTAGLWNHESYECIMYGMDYCGQPLGPPPEGAGPPHVQSVVLQRLQAARQALPPHHVWLNRVLGMSQYTPSGRNPAGWT